MDMSWHYRCVFTDMTVPNDLRTKIKNCAGSGKRNEHNNEGVHARLHKWAQSCALIILVYSQVTGMRPSEARKDQRIRSGGKGTTKGN